MRSACATDFDMMKAAGMDQLWRHSLGVSMTAHILSTRAQMKNPDEVFVAGLLHDIGKAVLYVKWTDVGGEVERVARTRDGFMLEAEQELLELTHADLGGVLATSWHLPVSLRESMMYHHNPTAAQEAAPQTAIVRLADLP